ncbi:MAG TPA: hypothetical protein VJ652_16580 [Noviherbaspirillum sp.]|nr:hypothetical protein [Noviherbaspirillum sp.]
MQYSDELAASLAVDHASVDDSLQDLLRQTVQHVQAISNSRAKEHLIQGASRRLKLLRRSMANVFRLFPPQQRRPLDAETIQDVEINLHVFVINLYGIFENLAWAFVLRHELESKLGNRNKVSLFLRELQDQLPTELREYLTSPTMLAWQRDYLKNYRDSLAHRIPLYIPPSTFTPEEGEHFTRLDNESWECIKNHNWERLEDIQRQQSQLGRACPAFLHLLSATDGSDRPIYLHPQMICDAKTVLEFMPLYLRHWHETATSDL